MIDSSRPHGVVFCFFSPLCVMHYAFMLPYSDAAWIGILTAYELSQTRAFDNCD